MRETTENSRGKQLDQSAQTRVYHTKTQTYSATKAKLKPPRQVTKPRLSATKRLDR